MVLLLNYLPYIIIIIGMYIGYKQYKKHRGTYKCGNWVMGTFFFTALSVLVLTALTNGYIPKASVERIPPPDFSQTESENAPQIQNRLRKPDYTREEAAKRLSEMSDWRATKENSDKPETESTPPPLPPQN